MKLFYDGQIFSMKRVGGINRYFQSLIKRLPPQWDVAISTTDKTALPNRPGMKIHYYPRFGFRPGRINYKLEKYYFRMVEATGKFDLFHPTFYKFLTRREHIPAKYRVVVTVWDFLHRRYPEQLDPDGSWGEQIERSIRRADSLICISESTQRDLAEFYPELVSRSHVIPLASEIAPPVRPQNISSEPYLLYVGGRSGYKNFVTAAKAFRIVRQEGAELKLVIVGPPLTQEERSSLGEAANFVETRNEVTDDELPELYAGAVALLYTSCYEGFGLPIVEALSCGCIVICGEGSSLKEAGGDAAVYCEPLEPDSVADCIRRSLQPSFRSERIERGRGGARKFSWDRTVSETVKLYQRVCDG